MSPFSFDMQFVSSHWFYSLILFILPWFLRFFSKFFVAKERVSHKSTRCRRFAARFLYGKEKFQEKPLEPGSQSNNRICFRLIIQKEAAVT